ncbi:hypothetical protein LOTGIDRAFT_239170 [Lottia gigantea]|uniref:Glycine-rich protein n=2 Tax=Lottia gigantea TaxID=225164 RepID=GRP_LOTGI|nr:hypothetical protein LOTGIDRAFT_239170 [Lottia gigantea]B3A0R2.1 RecName: Full=Glycine-rich protein; AltName: Full=Uncharacterized shell protein 12; Short=LUSP-12; Flags: Precursor [Lottia gigantea]ESO97203.1 hypothetical protein LOTGIDRAFT_239170 [Lottia gigantea]
MKLTLAVVVVFAYIATTNAINPAILAAMTGGGGGNFKQMLLMDALFKNQNIGGGGGGGGGVLGGGQSQFAKMIMTKMLLKQFGENPLAAMTLMGNQNIDPMTLIALSGGENMQAIIPIIMRQQMQQQMRSQMPPVGALGTQMTPM